jgi:signal transduction histidine kinase
VERVVSWLTADGADAERRDQPSSSGALLRWVLALARSHPMAADALLAAVVLALSIINASGQGYRSVTPAAWVLQVALVTPLVWRRQAPVSVFVVVCAVAFVQWLYGERFVADLSLLVSLYTVTRRAPRSVALAAAGVVEVGVVLAAIQGVLGVRPGTALVLLSGMVAAAFFLGTNLRTREAYLAALVERARRLEYERDQQARIAAAAERASIAREMHDIVAHSLSVIVTMADAAALKHRSNPAQAAATMEQVSEVGRQALGETRRLVGVLRTDVADGFAPQPGLDQLDALLQQVRATGLSAELSVTGLRFAVPDSAELASYRIVQEALTNTLKHARGATRVNVGLRYAAPVIEIEITDDGRSGGDVPHVEPTGHGVVGMQERAALYHGAVAAGPLAGGGWGVKARLSLENGAHPGR